MKNRIKIKSYIISAIIIGLYSYVFFKNIFLSIILAFVLSKQINMIFYNILIKKEEMKIKIYFREFLDILNASILSGNNLYKSIQYSVEEMKKISNSNEYFNKSLKNLLFEIDNGSTISKSLDNFKNRNNLEEISILIDTLIISIKSGIDIGEVINNSKENISRNISIGLEIDTIIENSKRELIIMIILPIFILIAMEYSIQSHIGIFEYIIRIPIFSVIFFAFKLGYKIVNLEV